MNQACATCGPRSLAIYRIIGYIKLHVLHVKYTAFNYRHSNPSAIGAIMFRKTKQRGLFRILSWHKNPPLFCDAASKILKL
jgi:hypothetical protein